MRVLTKLRRELLVALSKSAVKRATVRRGAKRFKIPLFNGIGRFLFLDNEPWRRMTINAVKKMNPDTVLDIGVNVGQTLLDVKEIIPEARYIGFEPNAICVFYANELARLNDFSNVSILPFGLGEKPRVMSLHSSKPDDASSSILGDSSAKFSTSIYVKKGDEFISEEGIDGVSLIKIDTEGYELFVLKGLEKTILSNQPIIFCEVFANKQDNKEIYGFIKKLDYIIYEQGENLALKEMSESNLFKSPIHDYIFAPRKKSEEFEKNFTND